MKVVIQKVHHATLTSEEYKSQIGFGLIVTVGASMNDTIQDIKYLAKKIANLRIFKNEEGKCNLSLLDVKGEILVVSNFTLQARIGSGTRPDFSRAGDSEKANLIYEQLVEEFKNIGVSKVEKGYFKHHMHIDTQLDGPFTLILESEGRK